MCALKLVKVVKQYLGDLHVGDLSFPKNLNNNLKFFNQTLKSKCIYIVSPSPSPLLMQWIIGCNIVYRSQHLEMLVARKSYVVISICH